jgi:hypothetical protein
MSKKLKKYIDIALSNTDVLDIVNKRANLILYPDLHKYKDIDQVLGRYGAAFILFCSKPRYGHWVALIKRGNIIEFFNSYGGFPDDTLDYIEPKYRKESNQFHTTLSRLMYDSPYELEYNEFPFQKKGGSIKTCGRHAAYRILLKDLDLYEYKAFLDYIKDLTRLDYDAIITLATTKQGKY